MSKKVNTLFALKSVRKKPHVTKIVDWALKDERRAADNSFTVSRLRHDNGELP